MWTSSAIATASRGGYVRRVAGSMPPNGTLLHWDDVKDTHPWQVLLLGNGLSINVWPAFGYGALFDHVRGGGLRKSDLALFDGSPTFERVLVDLRTAIRVAHVLKVETTPFYERYYR